MYYTEKNTLGLCWNRNSSTSTITPDSPSTIGGSCRRRVLQTSCQWLLCSAISASYLQSLTGYCLAHQYITSIHFLSGSRDFAKKTWLLLSCMWYNTSIFQHLYHTVFSLSLWLLTYNVMSTDKLNLVVKICAFYLDRSSFELVDDEYNNNL